MSSDNTILGAVLGATAGYFFGPDAGYAVYGGIAGAGVGSAIDQQESAQEQAEINRGFQERMSSTAHQRSVHDMRSAGINPILAAGAGSSTPSGGQASPVDMSPALTSALSAFRSAAEIDNLKSTAERTQAETENIRVQKLLLLNQLPKSGLHADFYSTAKDVVDQLKSGSFYLGSDGSFKPKNLGFKGSGVPSSDAKNMIKRLLGR